MLFAEVVYHTQETVLKTRNATQSAPLSSPSCVFLKGPPVSGTWKSKRGKQGTAVPRYSVALHLRPLPFSHDRSIQALDLPSVSMEVSHLSFMSGKLIFQRVMLVHRCCYYLRLSWFFSGSKTFGALILIVINRYKQEMIGSVFFFSFLSLDSWDEKKNLLDRVRVQGIFHQTSFLAIWSSKCS